MSWTEAPKLLASRQFMHDESMSEQPSPKRLTELAHCAG
jgi:hypothetical protein